VPTPRDSNDSEDKSFLRKLKDINPGLATDSDSEEDKEFEELQKMNLSDNEIVKELQLRKSERLALKLQREEERLREKEMGKVPQQTTTVTLRTEETVILESPNIQKQPEDVEETDPLRRSEKLALRLQEEESLALARSLQAEDERLAR
jgi:hypothetical protein